MIASLRNTLVDHIASFLKDEGFHISPVLTEGVLEIVNLIADYYEEGKHLYPEVVITNDMELFKTIPSRFFKIKDSTIDISTFKESIKLCAPLAVDGWIIFIEVKDSVGFGLVSTEMSETSLSLHRQLSDEESFPQDATIAYIRSIGQKRVEIKGLKNSIFVSLNLDDFVNPEYNVLTSLSSCIVRDIEVDVHDKLAVFIEKILDEAFKEGHGNLIGVVEDKPESIEIIKNQLKDGIYLEDPIDFAVLVRQAEIDKDRESSVGLRAFSSILKAMVNHDGISIFTTSGKVIGYHLFIKNDTETGAIVGGARSRAF